MSFISKLFSHHPQPEQTTSSPFVNWAGESGNEYPYMVYTFEDALPCLPGNYIYAKQTEGGEWIPLYIAQTRDMHQRLEGHEKMQDAMENGATHVHVHLSTAGQATRCSEERDLIQRWKPVCNEQIEG
jgi:hypothetical protein